MYAATSNTFSEHSTNAIINKLMVYAINNGILTRCVYLDQILFAGVENPAVFLIFLS